MPLSTVRDAVGLLRDITAENNPFQLGVEIENLTSHEMTAVRGFPFFPSPKNCGNQVQCGQSPATEIGAKVGKYAPDRSIPPHGSDTATSVDVWDCNGVLMDGNIGSMMYLLDGVQILVSWSLTGLSGENMRSVMMGNTLSTDPASYWRSGGALTTMKGALCYTGPSWRVHNTECEVTFGSYAVEANIGGNKSNAALTVKVTD